MLLKAVFIAILIYFAYRAIQNLMQAVREDPSPRPITPPRRPTAPPFRAAPPERPQAAPRPAPTHREDVEDAKWVDL